MHIDWRLKAGLFRLFDAAPGGRHAYYLTQRYVTRTLPRPMSPTADTARWFLAHAGALRARFGDDLSGVRCYEWGAGWDLYSNLTLWCLGVDAQLVVDLNRWVRPWAVEAVAAHLRADPPAGALRLPERALDAEHLERDLRRHYGIDYRAPADARELALPAGSVDAVITTSVLEHIPTEPLAAILREARRLCREGGLASHVIDYSDHYSHSDPRISGYDFLALDDARWARFNPGIHFQNRLRHPDFRRLLQETGWQVDAESTVEPTGGAAQLDAVELSERFRSYPRADLLPLTGHFLASPAPDAPG